MANIERDRLVALEHEAEALQKVWLREREEQRMVQIKANAEIRRNWVESDLSQAETLTTDEQFDRRTNRPLLSSQSAWRKETRS